MTATTKEQYLRILPAFKPLSDKQLQGLLELAQENNDEVELIDALLEIGVEPDWARKEANDRCREDSILTPVQLDNLYNEDGGGEHFRFTRDLWRKTVMSNRTLDGYWEWLSYVLKRWADGQDVWGYAHPDA